jgi:hypothetical protein
VRKWILRNCLIACCVSSSSLSFAQNLSRQIPVLPEQTVALQNPALIESTDSSGSATTSAVQEAAPTSDPQDIANGSPSPNGSASPNGSTSPNGSKSPSGSASPRGAGSATASTVYVFPSSGSMNRYWLRSALGPKAWIGAGFTASWNTWVNTSPTEWHRDGTGWSKRLGTAFLDNGINTSTLVLWSRAMHQDPQYYRCDCSGAWARSRHAIKMTFMARNQSGGLTFSPAKIISPYTGPLVTRNTIYPDRFGSGDALSGGGYYLIGGVAWNLFKEFIWNVSH